MVESETRAKSARVVVFHCLSPRFHRTTKATSSIGGTVGTSELHCGSCAILFNRSWVVMNIGSFHDREHAWFSPTKRGRKLLQSPGTPIQRTKKTKSPVYFARTLRSARPMRAARRQTDSGMPPMQCPAPTNSCIVKCMTSHTLDPITRSVVQHRLSSIVAEMGEAMLRTSYSQIPHPTREFSLS